jgi:hypothetical protein
MSRTDNPVSAAMARSHPDAEDDFYDNFWDCVTFGQLHDLTFNTMHVEGRPRKIDWRRLERALHRSARGQQELEEDQGGPE